jgi:hypothetical protein
MRSVVTSPVGNLHAGRAGPLLRICGQMLGYRTCVRYSVEPGGRAPEEGLLVEARALHGLTGEVDDILDAPEDTIASHIDSLHAGISARQRQMLTYIAAFDDTGAWADDGCRDMAMWLAGRLGIRPFCRPQVGRLRPRHQ